MKETDTEIANQYQKRTIITQTEWMGDEFVPYVIKRFSDPSVSRGGKIKDSITTTRVINMQAIHMEESSSALVNQAEKLKRDLENR